MRELSSRTKGVYGMKAVEIVSRRRASRMMSTCEMCPVEPHGKVVVGRV